MDATQELKVPEFPTWDRSWGFAGMEELTLPISHKDAISSDFALTWLWGECQRWQFVEQTAEVPDQKNIVRFLHSGRTLLLAALHIRHGKELPSDFTGNFEDIWEMRETWESRHGSIITIQSVIDSRLKQNGGWDADKMGIDLQKYERLCESASYDWQDSIKELGFNLNA